MILWFLYYATHYARRPNLTPPQRGLVDNFVFQTYYCNGEIVYADHPPMFDAREVGHLLERCP